MTSRWYVLTCKPNKEEIVFRQLQSRGYEVFYPRYFSSNGKSGRLAMRSYFPGYMFIRLDLEQVGLSTFQWMPNTEGLVCFGMKPAFVPDLLIEAIRRHVSNLNAPSQSSPPEERKDHRKNLQPIGQEAEYRVIFDSNLTSNERAGELLRMLHGLNVEPNEEQSTHI